MPVGYEPCSCVYSGTTNGGHIGHIERASLVDIQVVGHTNGVGTAIVVDIIIGGRTALWLACLGT